MTKISYKTPFSSFWSFLPPLIFGFGHIWVEVLKNSVPWQLISFLCFITLLVLCFLSLLLTHVLLHFLYFLSQKLQFYHHHFRSSGMKLIAFFHFFLSFFSHSVVILTLTITTLVCFFVFLLWVFGKFCEIMVKRRISGCGIVFIFSFSGFKVFPPILTNLRRNFGLNDKILLKPLKFLCWGLRSWTINHTFHEFLKRRRTFRFLLGFFFEMYVKKWWDFSVFCFLVSGLCFIIWILYYHQFYFLYAWIWM